MTAIEFNFTNNTGAPDNGTITFTPTRKNRHELGVSLPEPFAMNLTDQGAFSVELKPTPPHWVWRITVQINGAMWDTAYYYIPDRSFPIRYEDLTPVDPSTVQTGLNPEPAWWAHVDAVKAGANDIAEAKHYAREAVENLDGVVEDIEGVRDQARDQITGDREAVARDRRAANEDADRAEREAGKAYDHAVESRINAEKAAQAEIDVERAGEAADSAEQSAATATTAAGTAENAADTATTARDETVTARDETLPAAQTVLDYLETYTHLDAQTVNIPSDYPTLQDAVDSMSSGIVPRGKTIDLNIETGHNLTAGINVTEGDYSLFRIVSEDDTVYCIDPFVGHFLSGFQAKLPQLHTIINMQGHGDDGIHATNGSQAYIAPGAGIRAAGGRCCYANQGSTVIAAEAEFTGGHTRNVWITRASTFEGSAGNFSQNNGGDRAVYISRGSFANIIGADLTNARGDHALYVLRSFVCAQEIDVTNAEGNGIVVTTGSTVSARDAIANNCGDNGIWAMDGGNISAENSEASQCRVVGYRASDGSTINARNATATNNDGDGYRSENGSTINANSATSTENGSAGFRSLYGSTINARNATATNNTGHNYMVVGGSQIAASNATGDEGTPITAIDVNTVTALDAITSSGTIYT